MKGALVKYISIHYFGCCVTIDSSRMDEGCTGQNWWLSCRKWWLTSVTVLLRDNVIGVCVAKTDKQSLLEGLICVPIINLNDFVATIVNGSATKGGGRSCSYVLINRANVNEGMQVQAGARGLPKSQPQTLTRQQQHQQQNQQEHLNRSSMKQRQGKHGPILEWTNPRMDNPRMDQPRTTNPRMDQS